MRAHKESADKRAVRLDDDAPAWRPIVRRLLIGVGLVAVGLVWSILNGTVWAPKGSARPTVVTRHGAVATSTLALDAMRARPELLTTTTSTTSTGVTAVSMTSTGVTDVRITFHNGATTAWPVAPRDVYLLVDGRTIAAAASGAYPLRPITLSPGAYTVGGLRFAHAPSPGMTLVYAPSWAGGRSVRWLLYQ
jgi:hypothetical protein